MFSCAGQQEVEEPNGVLVGEGVADWSCWKGLGPDWGSCVSVFWIHSGGCLLLEIKPQKKNKFKYTKYKNILGAKPANPYPYLLGNGSSCCLCRCCCYGCSCCPGGSGRFGCWGDLIHAVVHWKTVDFWNIKRWPRGRNWWNDGRN